VAYYRRRLSAGGGNLLLIIGQNRERVKESMNEEQKATLDQHFKAWEVEGAAGELRYQATPKGSIIGFYGYAANYEEAYANLMRNAVKV